jgi:hypothetical protein
MARRDAGALRIDHQLRAAAVGHPCDHLAHGRPAAAAVDRHRAHAQGVEAEDGGARQLPLHHEARMRQGGVQHEDVEHRLVLRRHHHAALRDGPAHLATNPADDAQGQEGEAQPQVRHRQRRARRDGRRDQSDQPGRRHGQVEHRVEQRAAEFRGHRVRARDAG